MTESSRNHWIIVILIRFGVFLLLLTYMPNLTEKLVVVLPGNKVHDAIK